MEYTEQQEMEFNEIFSKKRFRQRIFVILYIAFIIGVVFISRDEPETVFGLTHMQLIPIFVLVIGGGIIFSIFNWKCPACNKHLGRDLSPLFCKKCGVKLR